jgi:hypothetical protein
VYRGATLERHEGGQKARWEQEKCLGQKLYWGFCRKDNAGKGGQFRVS